MVDIVDMDRGGVVGGETHSQAECVSGALADYKLGELIGPIRRI